MAFGICSVCGEQHSIGRMVKDDIFGDGQPQCQDCYNSAEEQRQARRDQITEASRKILVTTTHHVDGYHATKYLGVESVEVPLSTGLVAEFFMNWADAFGVPESGFAAKLQSAKEEAMNALKWIAAKKGANAIVGIDVDYIEFTNSRIVLVINGTLVKLVAAK